MFFGVDYTASLKPSAQLKKQCFGEKSKFWLEEQLVCLTVLTICLSTLGGPCSACVAQTVVLVHALEMRFVLTTRFVSHAEVQKRRRGSPVSALSIKLHAAEQTRKELLPTARAVGNLNSKWESLVLQC